MLPSLGLKQDQRTCELRLKMYITERNFAAARRLITVMTVEEIPLTGRAAFLAMKAALLARDFNESMRYLTVLRTSWSAQESSEPLLPLSMMTLLIELACKEQQLDTLVAELKGIVVPEKTIETLLVKCTEADDASLALAVEDLARAQGKALPDSVYCLLIKGRWRARPLMDEVLSRQCSNFSPDLALAILEACNEDADVARIDQLFEKMKPKQLQILAAFVRFYINAEHYEKACDVYELDMQVAREHAQAAPLYCDEALQESIVDAAVVCGRASLAQQVLAESRARAGGHLGMIVNFAGDLLNRVIEAVVNWNSAVSHWVVLIF